MIYEMRTYQLKVGTLQKYVQQFEEKGLPIVRKYCTLVGYWTVESGRLNRVVHIWSFKDLEGRRIAREKWSKDKDWTEGYVPLALPMVESQESTILTATNFSPIQ
jgi:NIPSNAP